MKLAKYMKEAGLRDEDVARLTDVDRSVINRIRRGDRRPSWPLIKALRTATQGKVTANDFE